MFRFSRVGIYVATVMTVLTGLMPWQSVRAADDLTGNQTTIARTITRNIMFMPPREKAPQGTTGAASRSIYPDRCPQDSVNSDLPTRLLTLTDHQSLTVAERPTFLAYVASTSAHSLFFSLKDEQDDYYYEQTIPLSGHPGIVRISLPKTAAPLKVGQRYVWSVVLVCEASLRPDSPRLEGWVQRVPLEAPMMTQLQQSSLLAQAETYAAQGIWYDTIALMADLKQRRPQDLGFNANWKALLESVGLGKLATAPILN